MKHSQQNIGWHLPVVGRYHLGFVLGALLLLCAVLSLSVSSSASALTTVPTKMNFQGRLTDNTGNIKPNGTYNMKLRLYTVNSGGSAVWTEDRLVSAGNGVTVTNGLFSIQLGSVTTLPASLFASGALYLEVELPTPATATTSGVPTWTEGAMTPRNQMATSAYAYNSETLDGKDSTDFGQLVANNTWSGLNIFTGEMQVSSGLLPYSVTADEIAFFPGSNGFNISGYATNVTTDIFNVTTNDAVNIVAGSDMYISGGSVSFGTHVGFESSIYMGGIGGSDNVLDIYNNNSSTLFRVTKSTSRVQIGSSTADSTGVALVLDTKNTAGDPSGTNGAMYYNSILGKARCYQAGTWIDCFSSASSQYDKIQLGADGGSSGGLLNINSEGPSYAATSTYNPGCIGGYFESGGRCISGPNGTAPCAPWEFESGGQCYEDMGPSGYTTYTCPSGGTLGTSTGFTERCITSDKLINVRTASGFGLFSVSTTNKIQIGSSTSDSTGIVLILDKASGSSDPAGVTGAMYYNTTMKRFRCYGETKWVDCRSSAASNTAVSSVTNTTTETQFTGVYGVEANECVPGRTYRVTARGTYSQAALATNLTMKLKWGSTVLTSTAAQAMGAVAMTNQQWTLETDVVCQTTGASGTVEAMGSFERHTAATTSTEWAMANTGPVTVNTTVSANIAVTAQWSVANASNSITLRTLTISSLDNGN